MFLKYCLPETLKKIQKCDKQLDFSFDEYLGGLPLLMAVRFPSSLHQSAISVGDMGYDYDVGNWKSRHVDLQEISILEEKAKLHFIEGQRPEQATVFTIIE